MELKKIGMAALATGMWMVSQTTLAQTPLESAAKLTDNERFEDAARAIRSVLMAEPNNGEAWFLLGENYYANDQLDSAQIAYQRGVQVNPLMPLNAVGLGKVLQARGKSAEAKAAFEACITKALDKSSKTSKPMQASVYREAAEGLINGAVKDPTTALDYVEKAIALDPASAELYIVKGDALFEQNSRDASAPMSLYKKAGELEATNAKPIARKAFIYYRAKNFDAAIAEYDNAIAMDAAYAPAYRGRAEAYYFKRDFAKATADYNQYLSINKGNVSARVRYAKFLYLTGEHAASLKEIGALKAAGVRENTLTRIEGYDYNALGDFYNALASMEEYFEMQPKDQLIPSDYEIMGKVYEGLAKNAKEGTVASGSLPAGNLDSLAAEMCLICARMDRTKTDLFTDAASMFRKAKMYDMEVRALQEKVTLGEAKVNDYYYLGSAANKARMFTTADSAWAIYVSKQPNIYQGYLGRARANVGIDSTKTTWQARPYFEEVVRKMKPEDITKSPTDAEEAYFYLGFYHFYSTKDLAMAKCWFEKVKANNAGTGNTKIAADMLLSKELKDVKAGACEIL